MDSLDQLIHSNMSKKSRRWPLCFFRNLLNVAGVTAFVLWTLKHSNWKVGKSHKRTLFLQKLTHQLVENIIQRRIIRGRLSEAAKHALQLIGYSLRQEVGRQTTTIRAPKRKRCHIYPRNIDRKTLDVCSQFNQNVCAVQSHCKNYSMQKLQVT